MRRASLLLALALLAAPVAGQNLRELATTKDDYSACTEPTADKLLCDFSKVPPYQQYDIERRPSTCGYCDEFTGDDDQLTWRWGNQGSSTITYQQDLAYLATEWVNGTNIRARWTTGPDGSATDWVMTAKISNFFDGLNQGIGLALLTAGSEASPTKIYLCSHENHGGAAVLGQRNLTVSVWNSYTSFSSNPTQWVRVTKRQGANYLRMRYVSSTKGLYCGYSGEGLVWLETTVQTLSAHPTTSMGFYTTSPVATGPQNDAWVWWWRTRSDSTGTTAPYPAGE